MEKDYKSKNKALIICSRNNHYKVVKPVMEEMHQRGWNIKTFRLESLGEILVRFFSLRKSMETMEIGNRVKENKKSSYDNLAIVAGYILYIFFKIGILDKPSIILVITDATFFERAAIYAGRRLNIPSVRLQIGLIGSQHDQCNFLVDKMAISGEVTKEVLINICGFDPGKLVITGAPTYDRLVNADQNFHKKEICKKLNIDPDKKIIVFATENLSPKKNTALVTIVCKAIRDCHDVQLVIKVHPGESDCSTYKKIARDKDVNCLVIQDVDIHEILYISDLLITYFSATGLEAMILKKPLITLNPFTENDPVDYAKSGAALITRNEKELKEAVNNMLYNETARKKLAQHREKYVYKQAYTQDGKATTRAVDLIEKMAR